MLKYPLSNSIPITNWNLVRINTFKYPNIWKLEVSKVPGGIGLFREYLLIFVYMETGGFLGPGGIALLRECLLIFVYLETGGFLSPEDIALFREYLLVFVYLETRDFL